MRADRRALGRLAARYGFAAPTSTRNQHLAFRHEATGRTVFFSSTSGDRRAQERLKQKFRAVVREQRIDDEGRPMPGCCDDCDGKGTSPDPVTNGQCWTCRGTGHPHTGPCGGA